MTPTSLRRIALAIGLLLLGAPPLRAAGAPPVEPGDLWEVTSQMSMEGMPMAMPAHTQKVCTAKEWKEPPGPKDDDQKCQTLDFTTTATKTTWKVRCDGPPPMTGEGEITRSGPDAYTGHVKMTSEDGVMTMTLKGRRVGDCDAGEQKRQVAQMEAQATQMQADAAVAQAQACREAITRMESQILTIPGMGCNDPALKAEFCKRFETPEGFKLVASRGESSGGLKETGAFCGKDPEQVRSSLCKQALADESLDFLGENCPAEALAIAQRECAGRKYTAMEGSKYKDFCIRYAGALLSGEQNAQDPKKAESSKDKSKKFLKGFIPH